MNNNLGRSCVPAANDEFPKKKKSTFREYVEAILTAVLIALVIRSFGIEAFKIPSSSMIPTLLIGDHIFVNKFIYGLRIPLTKIRFAEFSQPKRGDVIVFMYPEGESKDFIKRVVGLPGDMINVSGTEVYVNGEKFARRDLTVSASGPDKKLDVSGSEYYKTIPFFAGWNRFDYFEEQIGKNDFIIQYEKNIYRRDGAFEVPEDSLFVMGDNRDNSSDSREWGFVPLENVKGKAMFVWLSLDKERGGIRLGRTGKWIR